MHVFHAKVNDLHLVYVSNNLWKLFGLRDAFLYM